MYFIIIIIIIIIITDRWPCAGFRLDRGLMSNKIVEIQLGCSEAVIQV